MSDNPLKVLPNTEIPAPVSPVRAVEPQNDEFRFMLQSRFGDSELHTRLQAMFGEIAQQGEKIAKKKDIRDMRHYRGMIKNFLNEIVTRSHEFSRENFLDRRGRHRVYGIIRKVDELLDELAAELLKDESDNISILAKMGEIRGLLLDVLM